MLAVAELCTNVEADETSPLDVMVRRLVVAVEQVEGFGDQVEFAAFSEAQSSGQTQVGSRIVGARECVATVAGEPVVEIIRVLVRIAGHSRVERPSTAVVHDG